MNKSCLVVCMLVFSCVLIFLTHNLYAQENSSTQTIDGFSLDNYTPVTFEINTDAEVEAPIKSNAKEKKKKNFYYSKKTRKAYTQKGFGDNVVVEFLNMLKEPHDSIDTFVRDIYWYDFKNNKVRNNRNFNSSKGGLLHGPYKKMRGEQVVEEGIFYYGMKHGRWTRYDKDDLLIDKEKYYKGWPKESQVSYYNDPRDKQVQTVLPIEYGQVEGNFFMFFESGKIAVKGEYRQGRKVGKWYEYYQKTGKIKRLIQYPQDVYDYDDNLRGFVAKEWSMRGKVIYQSAKKLPKKKRRR